jgi:hypothetical protein
MRRRKATTHRRPSLRQRFDRLIAANFLLRCPALHRFARRFAPCNARRCFAVCHHRCAAARIARAGRPALLRAAATSCSRSIRNSLAHNMLRLVRTSVAIACSAIAATRKSTCRFALPHSTRSVLRDAADVASDHVERRTRARFASPTHR